MKKTYKTYDSLKQLAEDTINYIWENEKEITEYITQITKYYPEGKIEFSHFDTYNKAEIIFDQITSLKAIQKYLPDVILNFASAKTPGGGFLRGAVAQEETLARSSNLYPTLVEQKEFYSTPKAPYYTDKVIYSPDVLFFKDDYGNYIDGITCSVITCAAPNLNGTEYDIEVVEEKFLERIEKVLQIALYNNNKSIVLGAWGCGVFKNPPAMVSNCFRQILKKYDSYFEKIIFAIPDDLNFYTFKNVIS